MLVTAIPIQRSQRSKDDRVILPFWMNTTRVRCSNASLMDWPSCGRNANAYPCNVPFWLGAFWLVAHVGKRVTLSVASGTENVDVGNTCRPSTSTSRNERDDLAHSASRVKGPPRPRLRWACACVEAICCEGQLALNCIKDYTQGKVASLFLKDDEVHVQDFCSVCPWHFQARFRKRCQVCWTDLSSDRDTHQTPRRRAKIDAIFATSVSASSVELCSEDFYFPCGVRPSLHVEAEASLYRFGDLCASKSLTS